MTTVYRYEDKTGLGPYRCDRAETAELEDTLGKMYNEHQENLKKHPTWYCDFGPGSFASRFLSGCRSKEGLKKWFRGYNVLLKKSKFKVTAYKVKTFKVGKSRKQIRFHKDDIISKERVN